MEHNNDALDARGRPRVQTVNNDPLITVQSDADQADIKKILKRYNEIGIVDHLKLTAANFLDVSEFNDFADVMRATKEAEQTFMKLPSKVREAFGHSVENWLDTAHDPEKLASLLESGKIESVEQPAQARAANNPRGDGGEGTPVTAPEGG